MGLPLDVLIVRKIGHPFQREFALGAMAEGDVVVLDEHAAAHNPLLSIELQNVIEEEKARLAEYERKFHVDQLPELEAKRVILVDDGLATGATTEAAVHSAQQRGASRVLVAAPVASVNAVQRLSRAADEVHVLITDPEFDAVGRYYEYFDQTDDEEVIDLLRAECRRHP
jgi:putative phosphoribosyl transferase